MSGPDVDNLMMGTGRRQGLRPRALVAVIVAAVVASVGIGAVPAHAAPLGNGSISGRVVDGQGAPVAGICAHVENGVDRET